MQPSVGHKPTCNPANVHLITGYPINPHKSMAGGLLKSESSDSEKNPSRVIPLTYIYIQKYMI